MAIGPNEVNQGVTPYVPNNGGNSFNNVACVGAGDRVIFKAMTFAAPGGANNIVPDLNGYLPHFAYYPMQNFLKSIKDTAVLGFEEAVWGNDQLNPAIRVDFGPLYCPWAGTVTIEGGGTVVNTNPAGPGALLISYLWERAAGREDRGQFMGALTRWLKGEWPRSEPPPWEDYRRRVQPVATRDFCDHTFTVYSANPAEVTAAPRPFGAWAVTTSDAQPLVLSNQGAAFQQAVTSTNGQPVPLGAFTKVQSVNLGVVLKFLIRI